MHLNSGFSQIKVQFFFDLSESIGFLLLLPFFSWKSIKHVHPGCIIMTTFAQGPPNVIQNIFTLFLNRETFQLKEAFFLTFPSSLRALHHLSRHNTLTT